MGLLSKALKTAAKAAATAKDASRTKPKSQMNPLVKARKKPAETDFDKSASQEVKDFLSAVEEKDPNQLGEFYSPVINTLKEMPIGKQGTKGENISAFLNKRAPNVESSERASFGLKLDPQRKYTREEVIDIAKGDGSEEYTISKVNPSSDPMYNEYKGMQRQYVKDKEEEYFVLTVDSTKYLDAAGTKVHFGKPETNLGHTRSSIRRETPAGGPLTKKIKDRERYILIEEMQSDVATDYGKLKKADKKGKAPTSPDVVSIDNIVDQNIEIALEELEFDADVGLTIPNSKIINAIKQAHINMHKNNINRFEAGEDLARLLKTEHGIDFKGRAEIDAVSKNAIFNSLETEDGIKYGRDSLDVDDTIDGLFDDIETEIQVSKDQQKAYEQQQKGLPINPPIETRSDYVKKLILANINYAKRNDINKIVVPDYREIARQRINTFDYAMDQADDSNPTAIKNAELYNDLENGKITQDEYNIKYNKLAKEYFEGIFKKTYQDALKKVLNNFKTETKGAIKIGTRKLEYPAAGNFKGRTSTATEIDITDFDFDPETQALRFNMGGVVPPKNYAEGGVVSMNNQTQQAFALGGLKDEGGEIDEASGNRVPIGGTKEGVRDDIPANVSEGEFIFPADVVRYHGLDKMMALRQEAKMGLKQMERMGQMGNSEEASMPDDLPFEMADLIVVGGEGEPMEFAEGGYIPKSELLETADVPSADYSNIGNYEGLMTPPKVTMKEYRNADGQSIIITFVNGVANMEIPEGYTLYTPSSGAETTPTQVAIQTVNINNYRPNGDSEGPEPQPDQPAPDYRNMNDNEFFAYMAEQNSAGAKFGQAAGVAIGMMIPIPGIGLLVSGMMKNHQNNLMGNMKSRIDKMPKGKNRNKAIALFEEYGGSMDPEKKQGLLSNIASLLSGIVTPVANALGINKTDAAAITRQATENSIGVSTEPTSTAPITSLEPKLRPTSRSFNVELTQADQKTVNSILNNIAELGPNDPTVTYFNAQNPTPEAKRAAIEGLVRLNNEYKLTGNASLFNKTEKALLLINEIGPKNIDTVPISEVENINNKVNADVISQAKKFSNVQKNVVPPNKQSLYTGATTEGYGINQVDPKLADAVKSRQAEFGPNYTGPSPSAPFDTQTIGGIGPVTNVGLPIPGEKKFASVVTREGYNPTSSFGLDPAPMRQQPESQPDNNIKLPDIYTPLGTYDEAGINVQPPQPPQPTEAEQNLARFQRDQEFKEKYTPAKPNLIRENKPDYTSLEATQQRYGPSQRAGYESDMYAAMQDMPPVNYVVAPAETGQANRVLQKQPQTSVGSSYDEAGVQMQDPREPFQTTSPNRIGTGDPEPFQTTSPNRIGTGDPEPSQTDQAFRVPTVGTVTGPRGGYTQTELQDVQAQREAAALQASPDMFGPIQTKIGGTPFIAEQDKRYSIFGDELEPGFKDASLDVAAQQQTAAQARAREAATQKARVQTRNKEIAEATAKIPDYILNSKETQDSIKAGYVGSTTGGYAIGKISGSDGNEAGVVQNLNGKVTKVRDLEGYESLEGTQRGAMTVFSDAQGTKFVKSTFGKKTKLDGSDYTGPGITQADKGRGNTIFQSAANVLTPGDGKSYVGGELVKDSDSGGSSSKSSSSSGRTVAEIQADINKEVGGGKAWTSKANDLVAEREAAKKASSGGGGDGGGSSSSTTSSSSNKQSGTGFFRGADESGNTGSDSSKGGYSCYVATALSEKGYWSHTQKIKLIKWCIEAKPEGKLDTVLWRNGYCIFGKNIIAPKVDNKIIQWLSNGFYHATISNKKTLQAILGKLFFIIPSYTIGIWKALRGSLVDIERT